MSPSISFNAARWSALVLIGLSSIITTQRAELFDGEASVAEDTGKPGLLKSTYGVKVIDTGNLGQG
jgi:hypothetical protein